MLTADEHIEIVHQAIQETLELEHGHAFFGFGELLETVLVDRRPPTGSLPWLLLPVFVCEALGGDVRQAQQVAAALEIGRVAAGCLDEWQDQDTDDALWRTLGPARTVNAATGLISLSFQTLDGLAVLGAEERLILSLHQEFHATLLLMCAGQDADLSECLSLDDYELVAAAKSGSLFDLGCRAGAMVAGAPTDVVAQYGDFGRNLGIVGQMWNDLEGLSGVKGKEDADQQRGLPIVAAKTIEQTGSNATPGEEQVGSLYALVRLQVYHQRAAEALAQCPEAGRLTRILDAFAALPLVEMARQSGPYQEEDIER